MATLTTLLDKGSPRDSGAGGSHLPWEGWGVTLVVWEGSTRLLPSAPALPSKAPPVPLQRDSAAHAGVTPAAASPLPISMVRVEKH